MGHIKVFRSGAHAHRTPLSYPALAPLFSDRIAHVDRPEAADMLVFAHMLDIQAAPRALVEDWRARRRPVVLLSEEPFWDTIWGRQPLTRHRVIETRYGALPVVQLTHGTSAIFTFGEIPYYLLTHHRFAAAYGARFARNRAVSASEWRRRFAAREVDLTFMFERRPEPYHAMCWPEGDVIGLCSWRTELAEACRGERVHLLGRSWQGGPSRFELSNWHLDKITRLDDATRLLGAIENTHQPDYLTEKLFDAFACGAIPLYYASRGHRVHDLGLPAASWINLFALDPAAAAAQVAGFDAARFDFEAYRAAQEALAERFCDTALWVRERSRLKEALLGELEAVLDSHQPALAMAAG